MIEQNKNIIIAGAANHPIALDIFFEQNETPKPVVIYAHGFNGFKDWGNFDLMANEMARAGFALVKFNFSHNGTTPAQPEDFADLEAFGNNNYSIELQDLKLVTDWVSSAQNPYKKQININHINIIGHSMGGGIAILQASTDDRIKKLVTWASISECKTPWGNWPAGKMEEWKNTGVQYYTNSRTKQQMPLYYQLHEDFLQHEDRLNIQKAICTLKIPVLICHGTKDTAVPIEKAYALKEWQPAATLFTVDSDHVFDRKHPLLTDTLPTAMQEVLATTISFLNK
jgi:uncharacterized protein